ncbi:hypothetical protein FGO68_gene11537 [Halteria grandinella]|uniref:Uncharacterized protein n=1 Tax=Halteria grandinella TaxID=5974 RepID=A0A8J8T0R4_HALGN|nr:hypothetical protein FGO68_gene11537 [Halteria grandinella]
MVFHRSESGEYFSGHMKMLSISLGQGEKANGAIQLRGMTDKDNNLYDGPAKLADELIRLNCQDQQLPLNRPKVEDIVELNDFRLTSLIKNQGSSSHLLINQRIKAFKSVKQQQNSSQGLDVGLSRQKYQCFTRILAQGLQISYVPTIHSEVQQSIFLSL